MGALQRPSGGQSNETVLFDAEWTDSGGRHAEAFVLRLQAEANRMFLETDVIAEGRLLAELRQGSAVPVPAVVAVEPDAAVLGRPFFLMEHVFGHAPGGRPSIHRDPWLVSLSGEQRTRVCKNGLGALAVVHASDWRSLTETRDRSGRMEDEISRLRRWYEWAKAEDDFELLDAGILAVSTPPPRSADPVLLWGDARPGNILFADDLSVAAVIDWELATVGPREADVGWWLMMDEFAERGAHGRTLPGMLTREEAVAWYCELTGVTLRDLEYFVLLASIQLAVTLLPAARSLAQRGIIEAGSRFAHDNVPTQMIAHRLGRPEPELSPDYRRLSRMGRDQTGR